VTYDKRKELSEDRKNLGVVQISERRIARPNNGLARLENSLAEVEAGEEIDGKGLNGLGRWGVILGLRVDGGGRHGG
jgi:hypothetical protein